VVTPFLGPFRWLMPVRFADVDHAGIVYYPRFFHFFHLAFEELWRARVGARAYVDLLDKDRVGFPAVRAECDFKRPLRFGDTAELELTIARMGATSITFRYRVYRAAEPAAADPALHARVLAAEGQVVAAVVDLARFVAIAPPPAVVAVLADLVEPPAVTPATSP
jgi:4-hydroxybenzoyl-CoA thioesterase